MHDDTNILVPADTDPRTVPFARRRSIASRSSLTVTVDSIVSAARVPASIRPGLRTIGLRHGRLVLLDVVGLVEAAADDRVFDCVPREVPR
jgi:hypothetical protein